MTSTSYSQFVSQLPLLPPLSVRVSKRPRYLLPPLPHSSIGVLKTISKYSEKRRIACLINEESYLDASQFELTEDTLSGESVAYELHSSNVTTRNQFSFFQKAADSVFRIIGNKWTVPWSAETILQVMLLWISAFWFVGSWMIPFIAHAMGFGKESLSYRGQALHSLLTDITEGVAGVAILHHCLSRFSPLPPDWFRFSLEGNWQLDVALGCCTFPLVNRLAQFSLSLLPVLPSAPVALSSVAQSILARDPVAMVLYALVVSVCSPVWEEIVFRGFLLPSLTRYMPVWCSIVVSSVVFALAHFNVQRMLPLVFLGMVMGAVYARSRNLLPSMILHSLWNGFVFLGLMK